MSLLLLKIAVHIDCDIKHIENNSYINLVGNYGMSILRWHGDDTQISFISNKATKVL